MSEALKTSGPKSVDLGRRTLHLAAVGAAVGVLLALVFGIGSVTDSSAEPLDLTERLDTWRTTPLGQKQATAQLLLKTWNEEGILTPAITQDLADPARFEQLVAELVAAIDRANDHNSREYINPGESILRTGRGFMRDQGWENGFPKKTE